MPLTLDIPPHLEPLLLQRAAERGQTVSDYFLALIEGQLHSDRQSEKDQAAVAPSSSEQGTKTVEHA